MTPTRVFDEATIRQYAEAELARAPAGKQNAVVGRIYSDGTWHLTFALRVNEMWQVDFHAEGLKGEPVAAGADVRVFW